MSIKLPKPTPDQRAYLETCKGNYSPKDRTMSETGQPTLRDELGRASYSLSTDQYLWAAELCKKAAAELTRLQQSNAALVEAAEPFTKLNVHAQAPDDMLLVLASTNGGIIDTHERVTVGALRKLKSALANA